MHVLLFRGALLRSIGSIPGPVWIAVKHSRRPYCPCLRGVGVEDGERAVRLGTSKYALVTHAICLNRNGTCITAKLHTRSETLLDSENNRKYGVTTPSIMRSGLVPSCLLSGFGGVFTPTEASRVYVVNHRLATPRVPRARTRRRLDDGCKP